MSRISPRPPLVALDAWGVLARRLEFLASMRPLTPEELGNKRLNEAYNLVLENKYLICHRDMRNRHGEVHVLCVLPLQSIIESCSAVVYVSTMAVKSGVKVKERHSEIPTRAGILQVCQRCSAICRGHL
jgi:hypothetical protein